jgi:hypothetical protein
VQRNNLLHNLFSVLTFTGDYMLTIIGGVTPTKFERYFIYLVDLVVAVAIVSMTVVAVYQVNMGMI